MTMDVLNRLEALEPLSKSLNAESDSVNQLIDQVEERLAKLNLGVEASVVLDVRDTTSYRDDDDESGRPAEEVHILSYERLGIRWGLAVREHVYCDEALVSESGPDYLREKDRQTRIRALEVLPELIEELEKEAKRSLATLEKAKAALK